MKKYVLLRIIFIIVNLTVIFTLAYFALQFATNEKYYGLPFSDYYKVALSNYKVYIFKIIRLGDWGTDINGEPVWDVLLSRVKISLKINLYALVSYTAVGILLGFISALKKDSLVDRVITTFTVVLGSVPTYIMMFLLIIFVGFYWNLTDYQYIPDAGIRNYILPVLALSLPPIATFTRVIRGELIDTLTSDFLLLAKAKGLNRRQLMSRHLLRNSLIPLLPEIPTAFLFALTGSFFVELIYYIPGVAELFFDSLVSLGPFGAYYVSIDLNVMMIVMLFYTSLSLIIILITDLAHQLVDPRIRVGSKKAVN